MKNRFYGILDEWLIYDNWLKSEIIILKLIQLFCKEKMDVFRKLYIWECIRDICIKAFDKDFTIIVCSGIEQLFNVIYRDLINSINMMVLNYFYIIKINK